MYKEVKVKINGIRLLREVIPFVLILALMLIITLLFAPAAIRYAETSSGNIATIEIAVRIGFLLFYMQLQLILLYLLFVRPVNGVRMRLLLYCILAESLIVCSVWLFDDLETAFRSEESAITFFSALVLFLCCSGGFLNLILLELQTHGRKIVRVFWGLLAAAFLFAGIDEYFRLHEAAAQLGRIPNWGQDLLTFSYAVGAIVFSMLFYKALRSDLFNWNNWFIRLLAVGIALLSSAMFLDTFDRGFQYFFRNYIDANHLCNSLEELFEFTAACLFCCAIWTAMLEANEGEILKKLEARPLSVKIRNAGRALFSVLLPLFISGMLVLQFKHGIQNEKIVGAEPFRVTIFAEVSDGLKGPDGLCFSSEYGVIVCNELGRELLAFDADGRSSVLLSSDDGLASPEDVAIGKSAIYVSDDSAGTVHVFPFTGCEAVGIASDQLGSPEGLAIDSHGRLYIADEHFSLIVRQTAAQTTIIASAFDGLVTPEEIIFDENDSLYATDEGARAVFRISPEGDVSVFADASDGLVCPEAIVLHKDHFYVTDYQSGRVFRIGQDGACDPFLTFRGRFRKLGGITFDDRGFMYLVASDPLSDDAVIYRIELQHD